MKTFEIRNVLLFCAIGGLFVFNTAFIESEIDVVGPLQTVAVNDRVGALKTVDTIIIKNMVFTPSELHIHKGGSVIWINRDIVPHNVTDFPGNKWTSGTLTKGSSWERKIDHTLDYYCSIHPTMKGKVIVDP